MTDTTDIEALVANARKMADLVEPDFARLAIGPKLVRDLADALERQQAVVMAARDWRKDLEQDGWDRRAIEEGTTRPAVTKMMKALAALDAPPEGEG